MYLNFFSYQISFDKFNKLLTEAFHFRILNNTLLFDIVEDGFINHSKEYDSHNCDFTILVHLSILIIIGSRNRGLYSRGGEHSIHPRHRRSSRPYPLAADYVV